MERQDDRDVVDLGAGRWNPKQIARLVERVAGVVVYGEDRAVKLDKSYPPNHRAVEE